MEMVKCCFEPVELPEFIETAYSKCTDPKCEYDFYILSISFLVINKYAGRQTD